MGQWIMYIEEPTHRKEKEYSLQQLKKTCINLLEK